MENQMSNMPKVKIGIVAVSRDCFPESLSVNRRKAVVEAYTKKYGDAYCGMLNASYNLKLRGVKAYIPEYPVGNAEECAEMLHEFVPIARAVVGLSSLKIISFGPRPLNFLACNAPIQQLYNLGVEIEKNFPHHGAVAFGNFGKTLYEVFKYVGVPVEEIGYNQPAGVRYPTENPWG